MMSAPFYRPHARYKLLVFERQDGHILVRDLCLRRWLWQINRYLKQRGYVLGKDDVIGWECYDLKRDILKYRVQSSEGKAPSWAT